MKNPIIKKLSFWVTLCCLVLGLVQGICLYFNVSLPINLIIEGIALILSILVCFGVLKRDKKEDANSSPDKIKNEIYDDIKNSLPNLPEITKEEKKQE